MKKAFLASLGIHLLALCTFLFLCRCGGESRVTWDPPEGEPFFEAPPNEELIPPTDPPDLPADSGEEEADAGSMQELDAGVQNPACWKSQGWKHGKAKGLWKLCDGKGN